MVEYSYHSPEQVCSAVNPAIILAVAVIVLAVCLVVLIIKAVIYCKIFHKTGYCWAMGLLMLIPIARLIMPFILAFGKWPIEKELERLRLQQSSSSG